MGIFSGGGGGGAPTGTAGGSLSGTYPDPGIATGAVGPAALASTAVTPATYGDSANVGQFTVDADGRLTGASSVAIGGPTGTASGDLSGTYPSPTVAKVKGVAVTSVLAKLYLNKPAGNITRAATSVGAFSTAWQITSVVVAAGQNVLLRVSAAAVGSVVNNNFLLALFRDSTQLAAHLFTSAAASTMNGRELTWIDETPGAGTYTYEVQGAQFAAGTLTVYQTNITSNVEGGTSIFTAEVYTP